MSCAAVRVWMSAGGQQSRRVIVLVAVEAGCTIGTDARASYKSAAGDDVIDTSKPIVWRLSLASSPEDVFELLDTDAGRTRFWAERSRATDGGFELEFPGGVSGTVKVLERDPPHRLVVDYFGARCELDLDRRDSGGCLFRVTCHADDPAAWVEFLPGWVSWLLVLKGVADFGVDLRNGAPDRTWRERYVDQ